MLQAGVFYKRIEDFIVNVVFEDSEFLGVDFSEALIPQNGDEAKVKGLELSYQQSLNFLPAPLDGVIVGFNYTYTDARAISAAGPSRCRCRRRTRSTRRSATRRDR